MKFRITVSLITVLCLVASIAFNVSAIKVDGYLEDKEWKSAVEKVLIPSSDISNGTISFGVVYIICDKSADKLTFGFKATVSEPLSQKSDYGVGISLNSGEFIYVRLSGVSVYDSSKYSVDGRVISTYQTSFTAEVVVALKYGIDSVEKLDLRFVDGNSVPTKVYAVPTDAFLDVPTTLRVSESDSVKTTRVTSPKSTKPQKTHTTLRSVNETTETTAQQTYIYYESNTALQEQKHTEDTTVMALRNLKVLRGFSYAAIAVLILLAFAICVMVNLKRDNEKNVK